MIHLSGGSFVNEAPQCPHLRTQVIAKDSEVEYVECLDCGAIIESSEQPQPASDFDESLSDA